VKAGLPESAIMMISGHRTRKVFDRYVNLKPLEVKDMLIQLRQKASISKAETV